MNKNLSREDMMEATWAGVRDGIIALGSDHGRPRIPSDLILEAIRNGVADAFWRIATNATDMPSSDFFEMVRLGAKEGMERVAGDGR